MLINKLIRRGYRKARTVGIEHQNFEQIIQNNFLLNMRIVERCFLSWISGERKSIEVYRELIRL